MTQSQTSYINDNGTNIPIPSTPYANKSTSDKIKLTASKRVSRKSNVLAYLAYTNIDKPYMNPHGLCENGLNGQDYTLVGSPSTWYFQRSRYGNGTSLPSQSITGSLRGSHQFSSRTSLSAFLTGATEKNDQLNSYEFDRDLLTVGGNVWTAPHDKWMFTLGYTYNMVKSNAKLCPPIMDG